LSYGFRGEALHSLVKLSRKLTILSTSDDSGSGISKVFSDFGNKIDIFDKPRTKGTTICIEGLFECISIRRQDWFKRKSMIFSQVVFLLQSFSVLTANVKFSVYNVKDNNSKLLVLHCSGEDIASRFTECLKSDHKKIEKLFGSFDIQGE
jgi:DNA mismatch repair ATPase MutL